MTDLKKCAAALVVTALTGAADGCGSRDAEERATREATSAEAAHSLQEDRRAKAAADAQRALAAEDAACLQWATTIELGPGNSSGIQVFDTRMKCEDVIAEVQKIGAGNAAPCTCLKKK